MPPVAQTATLRIERLCKHHRVSEFVSTNPTMDETLRTYHGRLDAGEETVVFVASTSDMRVDGFVAIADFDPVAAVGSSSTMYLFISAVAVDIRATNRFLATRLMKKVIEVGRLRIRDQRRNYTGLLAMDVGDNTANWLAKAKFKPFDDFPPYFWRPIEP